MSGSVGILNVGAGDTKLTFDKSNPAECIRAGRIVRDMLRRGYALLVEVEQPDGTKAYQRALDFREETSEYIIADFDPLGEQSQRDEVQPILRQEISDEETNEAATDSPAQDRPETPAAPRARRGRTRAVPAGSTKAVAVARTAGG